VSREHCINIEQNKPSRIELLLAQRLYYARAKWYAGCFAIGAILIPVLSVLVGLENMAARPYIALASIALLLLEVWFFLPEQKRNIKTAARIQEQFDTEVLSLDWNKLVAGNRVDAEDIRAILPTVSTDENPHKLPNWYEPAISRLPLHVGRVLCQRTNISYDSRVRVRYAKTLFWLAVGLSVALIVVATSAGLRLDQAILTLAVPALPLVTYLLREWRKQADTVEGLENIKNEVQRLWNEALEGATSSHMTASSRALQDAIYRHRASNPPVFDWFYKLLRDGTETLTRRAIEDLVSNAEERLKTKGVQAR